MLQKSKPITKKAVDPPAAKVPSAVGSKLPLGILQHRLLQNAVFPANKSDAASNREQSAMVTLEPEIEEEIEVEFDNSVDPRDRWRYARMPDKSLVVVRIAGGWKKSADTAAKRKSSANHVSVPSENELIREKVLQHPKYKDEDPMEVHLRHIRKLIIESINVANVLAPMKRQQGQQKVPRTLESYFGNNASAMASVFDLQYHQQLLDMYFEHPVLSYLPLEDGGLRGACVFPACVSKSLHLLCASSSWCAFCMAPITLEERTPREERQFSSASFKPKKKSTKRKYRSMDEIPWEELGIQEDVVDDVSELAVGATSYLIHSRCSYALTGEEIFDQMERFETIRVTHLYHYETIDDAECDLCGRSGGVMYFFDINPKSTTSSVPSEDGWLAHVACLQILAKSHILDPIERSASDESMEDEAGIQNNDQPPVLFPDSVTALNEASETADLSSDGNTVALTTPNDVLTSDLNANSDERIQIHAAEVMLNVEIEIEAERAIAVSMEDIIQPNSVVDESYPAVKSEEGIAIVHPQVEVNTEANSNTNLSNNGVNSDLRSTAADRRLSQAPGTLPPTVEKEAQRERTIFDRLLNVHRCVLCGLQAGISLRCAGLGCTVRVHPLCASIAQMQGWSIYFIDSNTCVQSKSDKLLDPSMNDCWETKQVITCLCPLHAIQHD